MKIEVFGFAGCPNFGPAVQQVTDIVKQTGIDARICEIEVADEQTANKTRFLGSPTIRVNGRDVEFAARNSMDVGLTCRTYVVDGKRQGIPPREWIDAAILEAARHEDD